MNPWVAALTGLLIGVCVGKWFSARKQVQQVTQKLSADFAIELQGARAMAAASGGNVVMMSPGGLDELLRDVSANDYGTDRNHDNHVAAILAASRGTGNADRLGILNSARALPDPRWDLVAGGAALDERQPRVIES